jgi:hypothetical protein
MMAESETNAAYHYGYSVRPNPRTGRWEVYWKDQRMDEDFDTQANAEEWIDEQIPLNR